MRIYNSLLELLLESNMFEYNGTHNSDPKNPLWGRRAYWRAHLADGTYVAKITAPVRSINPKPATLRKLLKAELKRRIESIGYFCVTDHYGQIAIEFRDPSGVMPLVKSIEKKNYTNEKHRLLNNELTKSA